MPIVTSENGDFHLAHDEEDKLNQFQLITSFPEEELPQIVNLLRNHGWNLEAALGRYFDGTWKDSLMEFRENLNGSVSEALEIPEQLPNSNDFNDNRDDTPFANGNGLNAGPFYEDIIRNRFATAQLVPSLPIVEALNPKFRQKYNVVGLNNGSLASSSDFQSNPLTIILMFIPKLLLSLGYNLISILWSILSIGFNLDTSKKTQAVSKILPKPLYNEKSIDDFLPKLIENKDSLKRLNNLLSHNGNNKKEFNTLLKQCRDKFDFILIVILGDVENCDSNDVDMNSQKFLSKIICTDSILSMLEEYVLKQKSLSIYMRSVSELEPWLVAKSLSIRYTPEVLLVGNVLNANGSVNGITRPSVLSKLKFNSPKKFINSFKVAMERFQSEIIVSKTEQEELRVAREIKELQNQAYQASLEQDRIKEEKRKLELEQQELIVKEELEKEKDIKLHNTLKQLNWLKACVDFIENNSDIDGTIKSANLQIRSSKGGRLIKKFTGNTSLYTLYTNIGCHLFLEDFSTDINSWKAILPNKIYDLIEDESVFCFKNGVSSDDELNYEDVKKLIRQEMNKYETPIEKKTYELDIDFELISPFPRFKIPLEKSKQICDVAQIWPSGSLLVEDILSDESEKDDEDEEDE